MRTVASSSAIFSVLTALVSCGLIACSSDSGADTTTSSPGAGGASGGAGNSQGGTGTGGSAKGGAPTGGAGGTSSSLGGSASVGGSKSAGGNASAGAGGTTAPGGTGGTAQAGTGGATAGGSGGAPATLSSVCTQFWTARCNEWSQCFPKDLAMTMTDVASCIAAESAACADGTIGDSSAATVDDVAKCFAAYDTLDCPSLARFLEENQVTPAECNYPPGKLADGASCLVSSECASQFCAPDGDGCGVCGKAAKAGEMCPLGPTCGPGLVCDMSQTCVAYADKGAACGSVGCHADLACVLGLCVDRVKDGEVCNPWDAPCGIDSACNGTTDKCEPMVAAKLGDPCYYLPSGSFAYCSDGSRCDLAAEVLTGTCVAVAKVGATCAFDGECEGVSACHGGVCSISTFASCDNHATGTGGMGGAGGMSGNGGAAGGTGGAGGDDGLDHGAPSTTYPAPHPPLPQAIKGAGTAMTTPVIVPVLFENNGWTVNIGKLVDAMVASPTYFPETLSEYGIAQPTAVAPVVVTGQPAGDITDAQIQAFLLDKLDGTHPEFPPPDLNHVYTLFYPATMTVNDPGFGAACVQFGGYHSQAVRPDGTSIVYAVVPRCGASVDAIGGAASHEIIEAISDPRVGFEAWSGVDQDHIAWSVLGGGELGDLCEFGKTNTAVMPDIGFTVQRTWSNKSAAASHSPCVPWDGAYYAAAPVLKDDIFIPGGYGQTKGVHLPVGSSAVVELDLFSDMDTGGPFTISVRDPLVPKGAPPILTFSLDKTSGQNGEKAYVTITSVAPAPGGYEPFQVSCSLNGKRTTWYALVAQ